MKRHLLYSEDKLRGLLYGTWIGDAAGASFEGYGPDLIPSLDSHYFISHPPVTYTDDTQMTISVLEEMVENGEIIQESLKERFLKSFSPWRHYSGGMLEVIERWRSGEHIESAARSLYGGMGSFGDGAAMRVAPISAFFSIKSIEDFTEQVKLCSSLTHTHPYGISGAVLQGYAVLLALNEVSPEDWFTHFYQLEIESAYKIKLGDVARALKHQASAHESVRMVGNGADALDAVSAAIYSFLRNPSSFEDSLTFAISMGGDTDTIAAMTGAIAGAFWGYKRIPSWLLGSLENGKNGRVLVEKLISKAVENRENIRRGEDSNLR